MNALDAGFVAGAGHLMERTSIRLYSCASGGVSRREAEGSLMHHVSVPLRHGRRVPAYLFSVLFLVAASALPLTLPAAAPATSRAQAEPEEIEELSEVTVSGEKPTRKVADLIPWLRRLLGQYVYEGYVDLGGKGEEEDRHPVKGSGYCIGFGLAPGVQCEIHVSWPEVRGPDGEEVMGGVSTFTPAMILYGLEPDEIGIRYLQVDSKGLAEGGTGLVTGDTAAFRTPCADIPMGCQRVVRITARSESQFVDMQIDTELDYQLATRYRFHMTRIAKLQSDNPEPPDAVDPTAPAAPPAQPSRRRR